MGQLGCLHESREEDFKTITSLKSELEKKKEEMDHTRNESMREVHQQFQELEEKVKEKDLQIEECGRLRMQLGVLRRQVDHPQACPICLQRMDPNDENPIAM